MLNFSILGFPVRVHWTFWLLALLIGGGFHARGPEDWNRVIVAILVIFISILVHELGHALAGRRFGARPNILLLGTGGLCSLPGARFSRGQHILVSMAGPLAGFSLAVLFFILSNMAVTGNPLVANAIWIGLFINVFWNVLNLLPILPLDGGQIFRDLLGPRHRELVRWVGAGTAVLLALLALRAGFVFLALIAVALAVLNFQGKTIEGGIRTDNSGRL